MPGTSSGSAREGADYALDLRAALELEHLRHLLAERPLGLADVRFAIALVERLPGRDARLHAEGERSRADYVLTCFRVIGTQAPASI